MPRGFAQSAPYLVFSSDVSWTDRPPLPLRQRNEKHHQAPLFLFLSLSLGKDVSPGGLGVAVGAGGLVPVSFLGTQRRTKHGVSWSLGVSWS